MRNHTSWKSEAFSLGGKVYCMKKRSTCEGGVVIDLSKMRQIDDDSAFAGAKSCKAVTATTHRGDSF
jgi:hypothetical protein